MAQVVLAAVGSHFGGPVGQVIGSAIGAQVDRAAIQSLMPPRQIGPRLEALRVQGAAEGSPIPAAFGRVRAVGQIIWAARFREGRNEGRAGKGGPRTVDYSYSLSFAVGLCEGPIDGIGRVWADGQPFDATGVTMRVHRGAANQEADFAANRGIAELNSNLTIEAQKVRKELVMFAVGQVNNLRGIAAQGLTGYLNAFASLPGSAAQYASQKSAAKQALWGASKDYYQAQTGFKSMLLEGKKTNVQSDITHAQLKVGIEDKKIERDMKSMQVMVEVVGRLVAGAMAGINSHISLGANSNANVSESWSYNHET